MRRFAMLLLLALLVPLCLCAQENIPEIAYDSVPNLLKLPAGLYLGEAAGVAVNSKGDIFVFTRSGHTRLFEFDPSGKFLREIGQDLYGFSFAHTVRIDKDDNIWAVDEGANMVMEFDPQGRVIMLFGRKPEAVEGGGPRPAGSPPPPPPPPDFATFQERLFNRPTDVA
ncbi:MAG TPA: hypothetical protein VLC12_00040, partial [Terriglobales bacterium]|nr:hypothetical protein [Terriglobales bacterium]